MLSKYKYYILGSVFILLAIFLIGSAFKRQNQPKQEQVSAQQTFNQNAQNDSLKESVNGELVSPEIAYKRPIAIMVENHPDSRPQSGLIDADLIYEAPTEGGITRFLAIYQTKEAKNIGPIRSARTYFADIANEFSAVFAHVGGNSDALANIKSGLYKNISDADQFFTDPYFKRVSFRPMPHNVYTSITKLNQLIADYKFSNAANFENWKFTDSPSIANGASATTITVPFSEKDYEVKWQYNESNQIYNRILAGIAQKDLDTKRQLIAKNIIVQIVNTYPVKSDTFGSIGMDLAGEGKAYVFICGKVIEGTWKKQGIERTKYYDQNNREIIFGRGQTWIELLPKGITPDWN